MTFTETWSWTELKDWVTETGVGQVTAGNQEDIRIGYGGKGNTAKYADTVNNTYVNHFWQLLDILRM